MKFHKTPLEDAYVIEMEQKQDERGFFARSFCAEEYKAADLSASEFLQINNSFNKKAGTLRGMHYQLPPFAEVKVVRCIRGALYDVIVDIRQGSQTYGRWFGVDLTADNRLSLYVPRGFAHGFITLADNTEVTYLASSIYAPGEERGIKFDDANFKINWPLSPKVISDKDLEWPAFSDEYHRPDALHGLR
jgi:dTDP-4-dehydrorhamnose 3,5-epimerase